MKFIISNEINIAPNKKLIIEEGMEFKFGSTSLKVEELDGPIMKIIVISPTQLNEEEGKTKNPSKNYKKSMKFMNKEDIHSLGNDENLKEKEKYLYINDEKMKDLQVSFSFNGNFIYLESHVKQGF